MEWIYSKYQTTSRILFRITAMTRTNKLVFQIMHSWIQFLKLFAEKVSKGKVFSIVQVQQIVNSIQTHGLGILNYAVSKQLL